jgi:hypothetical protein
VAATIVDIRILETKLRKISGGIPWYVTKNKGLANKSPEDAVADKEYDAVMLLAEKEILPKEAKPAE